MSQREARCKRVSNSRYFHRDETLFLSASDSAALDRALEIAVQIGSGFNVIKFQDDGASITLLNYQDFDAAAFPSLLEYWTVSLTGGTVRHRSYEGSLNPPILHRKELLLPKDHPRLKEFEALTRTAEELGLFEHPHRIGFKAAWEHLLQARGYCLSGHELIPIGNDVTPAAIELGAAEDVEIARHRTALVRYGFSAPIQALARFGFLDGSATVFDYGCGRGDDVCGLKENGVPVSGWDPHFMPDADRTAADIVNLGFVINVIESREERDEALRAARALAKRLLVVSAMLAGEEAVAGKPYGDGIVTSRGTFQKYFTQSSLKDYLSETLNEDPIPVAPGVFFVFADKDAEQSFLYGRQKSRRNLLRNVERVRLHRKSASDRRDELYGSHRDLVDELWGTLLLLGRDPEADETPRLPEVIQVFGSQPRGIRFTKSVFSEDLAAIEEARRLRADDLKVYLCKLLFDKRRPYKELETSIRRDVKAFFGDYKEALFQANNLLLSLRNIDSIYMACQVAEQDGLGWLDHEDAFHVQTKFVERLPAPLRAYINCGLVLYGDFASADLIKIHVRTGKLSLMSYDGFESDLLPRLIKRTKISLRDLDFDEFVYGDAYPQTYLYRKSRFMNEEEPLFSEQLHFEQSLERFGLLPAVTNYGPSIDEFNQALSQRRFWVDGGKFGRVLHPPAIDDGCGAHLRFLDLIRCGETQSSLGLENLPLQPDSYNALFDLVFFVIDPVIDYFGMVKLTYGFCSHELSLRVPGRNDPKLDQHSAHERNSRGRLICPRGGAAADFVVEDEDMRGVAHWIATNCPFDRLYFYGADRPVHVSYSPSGEMQIIDLSKKNKFGNRVPRVIQAEDLRD